ncbi:MAG: branched-chain amino acid ABC transporter permease [Clostridia bacterium]|nr:branched-chain amino acid ABC transporter permease [Clostridia bacterium]MBQ6380349.1 branched-chain amino acid ABC transporter permease [Clostridia bacterium]
MTVDFLKVAEILAALAAVGGAVFGVVKWVLRQNKQDEDIRAMKEEQTLICFALKACLDGLEQLGANHTVPVAKDKLEKYLNQKAHDQDSA